MSQTKPGKDMVDMVDMASVVGTQVDLTVAAAGFTPGRSKGIYYTTSDGAHRFRFNITGSMATEARTGVTITITGIATVAVAQAISAFPNTLTVSTAYAAASGNTLVVTHGSASTTNYYFSGDIELASAPSL